ncbi:unnamed protein product [Psylliodes chrysocephalus]|uniref:Uncharacterized protein n=1 Tax=Psylliodes chrysocephalus TaxID=3402493 RepID=A0A9P0GBB2_9CUCU|nr:unnamed protein product [Psylliodes chrysocephala]
MATSIYSTLPIQNRCFNFFNFYYRRFFYLKMLIEYKKIKVFKKKSQKGSRSSYIGRAETRLLLPGAIPLLHDAGTFGCWVSPLARFAPPWLTWPSQTPSGRPY